MFPFALVLALHAGFAPAPSQTPTEATPQHPATPEYLDQYVAVLGGQAVPLERETAMTDTQSRRNFVITPSSRVFQSIPHPASPVRVPPTTHFLVRLRTGDRDPLTLIHLQPLKASKKDREITIVTYKQSLIPFGGVKHDRADDSSLAITVRKIGTDTLEIIPQSPLPPGEYAFVQGHAAQCFGVDMGATAGETTTAEPAPASSAPASPPPSPQPPPVHPPTTADDTPSDVPGYPARHLAADLNRR